MRSLIERIAARILSRSAFVGLVTVANAEGKITGGWIYGKTWFVPVKLP